MVTGMKWMLHIAALATALGFFAAGAHAACLVEYKAKRDSPLELFYDVASVSGPCTMAAARQELKTRLERQGLTLLKILSVKEE